MNEDSLKLGYAKGIDLLITKGPEILLALLFLVLV
jgi:hypothetical protein